MNSYIVTVVYCTQRNYFRYREFISANYPEKAKYMVLGAILDHEHKTKDRYIKIVSIEIEEV